MRRRKRRSWFFPLTAVAAGLAGYVGWKMEWIPVTVEMAETGSLSAVQMGPLRLQAATTVESPLPVLATPPVAEATSHGNHSVEQLDGIVPVADEVPTVIAEVPSTNLLSGSDQRPLTVRLEDVDVLITDGEYLPAHRELSKIYWHRPDLRPRIEERLERLAKIIFFSPQPHFIPPHEVQYGDHLRTIANQYGLTWQYVADLNRVDPQRIRPGQKLKVVRGPFSADVDLSDFELVVHLQGYFVRKYRVGIGREGTSPVGRFPVLEKLENPVYYGPDGNVLSADDPANPLGERWIDLGDSYGIHGTIAPDSIGRAASRGCIRLSHEDVVDVYDLLSVGSVVEIHH